MNTKLHKPQFFIPFRTRLSVCLAFLFLSHFLLGQTVTDTFHTSDISTNLGVYSPTCNGTQSTFSITLPPGGPWTVTSVDVSYTMTAQNGGFKSHQRSYIRCINTYTSESSVTEGTGNTGGTLLYNRNGLTIANGTYIGNTNLHFEMRAWRTSGGAGCNVTYNKVDNHSWVITIHLGQAADEGSVGIGTSTPATSAILDLSSTTQAFLPPRMTTAQRDAIAEPVPGMMIFNTTTQKLEIYISGWSSMTFNSPSIKKLYGGNSGERILSCQKTSDGGFVVAGYSFSSNSGTLTGLTNNGIHDLWIFRLDNKGDIQWQKLLGGSDADLAEEIQLTSDGGCIVAGYTLSSNSGTLTGLTNHGGNDYWVLKLDNNGNTVWQKLLGGNDDDKATGIDTTGDGGYIVTGYSFSSNSGTLTGLNNNGLSDCWIIKLNSVGDIVWQKLIGGSLDDDSWDIQKTNDGGFIVAANSKSSNTGTLTGLISNGLRDYWILKLGNTGNIIWQRLFGGSGHDNATSIRQTNDGGFVVAGHTPSSNSGTLTGLINNGASDNWIIKMDDSGNIMWHKLLGGSSVDEFPFIKQTSDDGFIVAGYTYSSDSGILAGMLNHGNTDSWIYKMDDSGVIIWQKLLGGTGDDQPKSILQTSDGGFISAGYTTSSNTGTLVGLINNGSIDGWVLKLDANGNPN